MIQFYIIYLVPRHMASFYHTGLYCWANVYRKNSNKVEVYWIGWCVTLNEGFCIGWGVLYVQCTMSQCYWLWAAARCRRIEEMTRLWVQTTYSLFQSVWIFYLPRHKTLSRLYKAPSGFMPHAIDRLAEIFLIKAIWTFWSPHPGVDPRTCSAAGKWLNH